MICLNFNGQVYLDFSSLCNAYRYIKGYFPINLKAKDAIKEVDGWHLYYV